MSTAKAFKSSVPTRSELGRPTSRTIVAAFGVALLISFILLSWRTKAEAAPAAPDGGSSVELPAALQKAALGAATRQPPPPNGVVPAGVSTTPTTKAKARVSTPSNKPKASVIKAAALPPRRVPPELRAPTPPPTKPEVKAPATKPPAVTKPAPPPPSRVPPELRAPTPPPTKPEVKAPATKPPAVTKPAPPPPSRVPPELRAPTPPPTKPEVNAPVTKPPAVTKPAVAEGPAPLATTPAPISPRVAERPAPVATTPATTPPRVAEDDFEVETKRAAAEQRAKAAAKAAKAKESNSFEVQTKRAGAEQRAKAAAQAAPAVKGPEPSQHLVLAPKAPTRAPTALRSTVEADNRKEGVRSNPVNERANQQAAVAAQTLAPFTKTPAVNERAIQQQAAAAQVPVNARAIQQQAVAAQVPVDERANQQAAVAAQVPASVAKIPEVNVRPSPRRGDVFESKSGRLTPPDSYLESNLRRNPPGVDRCAANGYIRGRNGEWYPLADRTPYKGGVSGGWTLIERREQFVRGPGGMWSAIAAAGSAYRPVGSPVPQEVYEGLVMGQNGYPRYERLPAISKLDKDPPSNHKSRRAKNPPPDGPIELRPSASKQRAGGRVSLLTDGVVVGQHWVDESNRNNYKYIVEFYDNASGERSALLYIFVITAYDRHLKVDAYPASAELASIENAS